VLRIPPIIALLFMLSAGAMQPQPQAPARGSNPHNAAPSAEAPVDINHVSLEQLLQVPGLTRSWAERIIRFRPYRSKLDLVQEGVLPGEIYNRVKDDLIAHREKP
jgi:DNA uptake protein ComE-like DNA-binding protein